ncbi:phosphopantetheine-binding protein [Actinophytocola sp.]|uniref:phosphopantetheine-binding protein n=1 Tax=Actinophytocola sp. TaxID=1872138 RepID=UPI002D640B93|nr:phosphopantetheine-binding protein [Actinophytocola sp.]HYQ63933.1 phosphopantetheine-binding protein [Actinophytocola sp.]
MRIDDVRDALAALDIDDAVDETTELRAELGMDSQEIVHLLALLEKRHGVALTQRSDAVGRARTAGAVVALFDAVLRARPVAS